MLSAIRTKRAPFPDRRQLRLVYIGLTGAADTDRDQHDMAAQPPPPRRSVRSTQITIRVEESSIARADRLLTDEAQVLLGPLRALMNNRNAVLRECLLRGLEVFEAELGLGAIDAPVEEPTAKPRKKARR